MLGTVLSSAGSVPTWSHGNAFTKRVKCGRRARPPPPPVRYVPLSFRSVEGNLQKLRSSTLTLKFNATTVAIDCDDLCMGVGFW